MILLEKKISASLIQRTKIATYAPGVVEFYFDNARTFMDLTLSQTIFNFTKIRYHLPHEGGSFPSIEDRFFALSLALEAPSKEIYNTR